MPSKKFFTTILGWGVSAVILWALFTRIDFHVLREGLAKAKWLMLVVAALINIIVVVVKSLRWQIIMKPGIEPERISLWKTFKATTIGMAGNNVLPARGGDWLKIYLLGKWASSSKITLTSITLLDKVFEGVTILVIFTLFSMHFLTPKSAATFPEWVSKGSLIILIVMLVAIVICTFLVLHLKNTEEEDRQGRLRNFVTKFGLGVSVLLKKKLLTASVALSFLSALLQILTIWACQMAFGFNSALAISAMIFIAINLAITIPSAPSGVGPFEAAAVLAYTWVGLKTEVAFNIAFMYHVIQFVPITLAGLYFHIQSSRKGGLK